MPPLPRTAWLEIDLDRLAGNLAAVKSALEPGIRVEPVVKADAYGHGGLAVASWLQRTGVDGLCVATLDEGVALRQAGIRSPILILYPIPPDGAVVAAEAGLAITAGDRVLLDRTMAVLAATRDGVGAGRTTVHPLAVHVEVETGLGRGGVPVGDVRAVVASIEASPDVRLAGIWSHLAAPGDRTNSDRQAAAFAQAIVAIGTAEPNGSPDRGRASERGVASERGGASDPVRERKPVRHLMATGGLLAASAPDHDSVRLGLGLYGLVPEDLGLDDDGRGGSVAAALRPVMSLHARPVRVLDLPAGHGVGYGPSFVTDRPSRIATLPLGYGDGWPRSLSHNAEALLRGRRVPLVGTVAMDALMADVTDVPGERVTVDDEFVLLGAQTGPLGSDEIGAAELARRRTSIAWEVVTQMARRMPRVYHAAAVPVGVRTLTEETYLW